jgi:hypothetical protein
VAWKRQLITLAGDKNYFIGFGETSPSGITTAFMFSVRRFNKRFGWGRKMKFQNIFRTHAVVIGFAAAFLFAGGARTQEIDNTVWADSANVGTFPQPAAVVVVNDLNVAAANSVLTNNAAVITQPSVDEETVGSGGAGREAWLIGMSIMLMAPLGVLVVGKVRREKQSVTLREYHSKKSAALS